MKKHMYTLTLVFTIFFILEDRLTAQEFVLLDSTSVSEDMYVNSAAPEANYEATSTDESELKITGDDAGAEQQAMLKFDISAYTLELGKFELAFTGAQDPDNIQIDPFWVVINGSTDNSWKESSIKWSNKPAITNAAIDEVNIPTSSSGYYIADVTSFINAQITAEATEVTLILTAKEAYSGSKVWVSENSWRGAVLKAYSASSDVSAPNIYPNGGQHESGVEIELYHKNADIFYTLDGSIPTSSSTQYTGDLQLTSSTNEIITLKAIAIQDEVTSEIITKNFAIGTQSPVFGTPTEVPGSINPIQYDKGGNLFAYETRDGGPGVEHEGKLWEWRENFAGEEPSDIFVDGGIDDTDGNGNSDNEVNDIDARGAIGWATGGEYVEFTVNNTGNIWYDIDLLYTAPLPDDGVCKDDARFSLFSIMGTDTFKLVTDKLLPCTPNGKYDYDDATLSNIATSVRLPQGEQIIHFIWTNQGSSSLGLYRLDFKVGAENIFLVTTITLNETSKQLNAGEQFTLTPTVSPATALDKTITWQSNKPWIASVNQSGIVTGHAKGVATISAKANGGGAISKCEVTVSGTVNTRNLINNNSYEIIPNPAKESIRINTVYTQEMDVSIYNISGRLMKTIQVSVNTPISVSSLPAGMYLVKISVDNMEPLVTKLSIIN